MPLDAKSKKLLILLTFLVPILIWIVWSNFISPSLKRHGAVKSSLKKAEVRQVRPLSLPQDLVNPDPERMALIAGYENMPWRNNPFEVDQEYVPAPIAPVKPAPLPVFLLQGIVWDENDPYAIINDDVWARGDELKGFIVFEITEETVTLKKGDEVIDLKLFPDLE